MTHAKASLFSQMKSRLEGELATLVEAVRSATEAATGDESKPENKYDTRGLEASYLAGAQLERVADVQRMLQRLATMEIRSFSEAERIAAGALVELEQEGNVLLCFVMPMGAGHTLQINDRAVQVVTTHSPLGKSLLGKVVGDLIEIQTGQGPKTFEVLSVN